MAKTILSQVLQRLFPPCPGCKKPWVECTCGKRKG